MTDGRRLDGYTISSPCEPNGSGGLKIDAFLNFVYPTHRFKRLYLIFVFQTSHQQLIKNLFVDVLFSISDIKSLLEFLPTCLHI